MTIINKLISEVKESFSNSKGSHGWDHTERVYNLCLCIGEKEKANLEVLKLAAILHDIAREHEDKSNGQVCHAEKGAVLAKEILTAYDIASSTIAEVVHCVETHRFRGRKSPQSKEAKILFDADKLDSIGAVGIGRAFLFSGEIGANLHHEHNKNLTETKAYSKDDTAYREYLVKLRYVKDKMQTTTGKKLAQERHDFMVTFFNRFNQEIKAEL